MIFYFVASTAFPKLKNEFSHFFFLANCNFREKSLDISTLGNVKFESVMKNLIFAFKTNKLYDDWTIYSNLFSNKMMGSVKLAKIYCEIILHEASDNFFRNTPGFIFRLQDGFKDYVISSHSGFGVIHSFSN